MVCGFDVAVINCHYNCTNCGFAANWDEGSDPSYEVKQNNKGEKNEHRRMVADTKIRKKRDTKDVRRDINDKRDTLSDD